MRALILAALGRGESHLYRLLDSPDTERMIAACRQLGAAIEQEGEVCRVRGIGGRPRTPDDVIDAGNSGLVLRFAGAVAALGEGTTVITGDPSIRGRRPAQPLLDGIAQLGGEAYATRGNGLAPLVIRGPIGPGLVAIDGADSQPVSALLIAASCLHGVTEIVVENEGERPFVEMTIKWLWAVGVDVDRISEGHYRVVGPAAYRGIDVEIPGDYSAAAFPLAAALVTRSCVRMAGLVGGDGQGDHLLLEWARQMGGVVEERREGVVVKGEGRLRPLSVDINPCIDALPIMAVLGCYADGVTHLYNGLIARRKESDRIAAIATELQKMGGVVEEREDGLQIVGGALRGAPLESWGDHRIAMALFVAALGAEGESTIAGFECVEKSFPHFAEKMAQLGARLSW